ncbi:hypothetical protein ACF0H5_003365 [Mactra antiquata]
MPPKKMHPHGHGRREIVHFNTKSRTNTLKDMSPLLSETDHNVTTQENKSTSELGATCSTIQEDHHSKENSKTNNKAEKIPSVEQISQWREDFQQIADVDGYITKRDLEIQLHRENKNPTDTDLDYLLKTVKTTTETDGEYRICEESYIQIQTTAYNMSFFTSDIEQELCKALEEFDELGDGTLKKEELKTILVDYDDATLDDVITVADINKDGRLSIKVLASYLTRTTR